MFVCQARSVQILEYLPYCSLYYLFAVDLFSLLNTESLFQISERFCKSIETATDSYMKGL